VHTMIPYAKRAPLAQESNTCKKCVCLTQTLLAKTALLVAQVSTR
jgi:hypothetical protein